MTERVQQISLAGFGPPPVPTLAGRPDSLGRADISYRDASGILAKGVGFLSGYDFTLNPYIGCTYSCTYCYAQSFVPDDKKRAEWGSWAIAKQNAIDLLARRREGTLDGKRIYMSSVTDAYQPAERKTRLTRGVLEVLAERHAPRLVVQTRSPDVSRDIDIFQRIKERGGQVQVNMTVTTDDDEVRRAFEPGCAHNRARLKSITEITAAAVQTAITMTPLLLVSDPETFADSLLATGVRRFIVQGFNMNDERRYMAHTRQLAKDVLSEKLGCSGEEMIRMYEERYRRTRRVLRNRLPNLGEGQSGFGPPF